MQSLKQSYTTTTEVKRSKFLTHIVPIEEYAGLQEKLKKEHPKANHVVYAVRFLNDYSQIVENSSDDGEPKGCAGLPALNVLRGQEMINCAVVIVRYFGGIKLGTGGMARAYALSVKDVLAKATIIEYVKEVEFSFESSYSQVHHILYLLKENNITNPTRLFEATTVQWHIKGSQKELEKFQEALVSIIF